MSVFFVIVVLVVFAGCHGVTLAFEKMLTAPEYALPLLGLAAICRTILPLGILLLLEYTTAFSIRDYLIPIALGYIASVGFGIYQG
ncbi:MAG: hypothetical protein ABL888_23080, partial [Pirellulaceae bacterium]